MRKSLCEFVSIEGWTTMAPTLDCHITSMEIWTETNYFIIFNVLHSPILYRGRRGRYLMVVIFTITYVMSAYHH